jgi:hypothetical protein
LSRLRIRIARCSTVAKHDDADYEHQHRKARQQLRARQSLARKRSDPGANGTGGGEQRGDPPAHRARARVTHDAGDGIG